MPASGTGHNQPEPSPNGGSEDAQRSSPIAALPPAVDHPFGSQAASRNELNGSAIAPAPMTSNADAQAVEAMLQGQPPDSEILGIEPPPPPPPGPPADDNEDDSEDGSSTDTERGLWINLQEDTSSASEAEIRDIEAGPAEISALDRE